MDHLYQTLSNSLLVQHMRVFLWQGCIVEPCSTSCPPQHPGLFLPSCFPAETSDLVLGFAPPQYKD